MGDATGKLPDAFKALGLLKLGLEAFALLGGGDALRGVPPDGSGTDDLVAFVADRRDAHNHVDPIATLMQADGLESVHSIACADAGKDRTVLLSAIGRVQHGHALADRLVRGPAVDALSGRIPAGDDSLK